MNFWVRIVIVIHRSIKGIYIVSEQILQNNGQFLITLYSPVLFLCAILSKTFLTYFCVLCWWCSCAMCCIPYFLFNMGWPETKKLNALASCPLLYSVFWQQDRSNLLRWILTSCFFLNYNPFWYGISKCLFKGCLSSG